VFTSGGLDSALLVGIATRVLSGERLHTFTVRFPGRSYDEGKQARSVAHRFGTWQVEVMAGEPELACALDTIIARVAEPIGDPAVLPTWLLAREARRHVGVVLSGEGADELFGGYPTYVGHQLAPSYHAAPAVVRRSLRWLVERLPSSPGKVPLEFLLKRFVAQAEKPWLERHIGWFGTGLPGVVRRIDGSADRMADSAPGPRSARPPIRPSDDVLAQAMLWDYTTYLRDNLLPKMDRATMLESLEARAPYLDRDLAAFAFGLPSTFKVRHFTTKWLLRRVARRWLPEHMVRRAKRGLSVPISAWINGGLRPEVERLLAPERLRRQGLLNPEPVGQLLSEHRAGRYGHARGIWALFFLQRWLERWA
ncbi:MAG: asparagine synthase C-terminal domain-containing protein, partial [Gemmatimonadetes bacterium]|nr:asparagine synthase C-terminal domain-containing protein [Gemmatimonadota bacterium]